MKHPSQKRRNPLPRVLCTTRCSTLPARRVDVVPSRVVRVDGTVVRVVVRAVKRVLVEAALLRHAVRVVEVGRATQEELHVALA